MKSHPNYKGYDATEGKPDKRPEKPTMTLGAQLGPLKASDLYLDVPKQWLTKLNAVREWCEERDIDFCPSPFPYQIAKVMAGDFTIVLWASKHKKHRTKFIKPAFEGPIGAPSADEALNQIRALVA